MMWIQSRVAGVPPIVARNFRYPGSYLGSPTPVESGPARSRPPAALLISMEAPSARMQAEVFHRQPLLSQIGMGPLRLRTSASSLHLKNQGVGAWGERRKQLMTHW